MLTPRKIDVSVDNWSVYWYYRGMNFYTLFYAIKNVIDTMDRVALVQDNHTDSTGQQNFPYAYGRLTATIHSMDHSVRTLGDMLDEIEKLREVAALFRLDDPKVIARIQAMPPKRLRAFEGELVELLDMNNLLEDEEPEPEIEDEGQYEDDEN